MDGGLFCYFAFMRSERESDRQNSVMIVRMEMSRGDLESTAGR